MTLDVMVDLETLGTSARTAILALGACAFDPLGETVDRGQTFYRNVDAQSCLDLGLTVDGGTIMWWLGQSAAARRVLFDPKPVGLRTVLLDFDRWYRQVTARESCIWSHGLTFDVPILSELYRTVGQRTPWFYSRAHDTRTLFDYCGFKLPNADTREGGHNALEDTILQAAGVQHCTRRLAMGLGVVDTDSLAQVPPVIVPSETTDETVDW